MKKNLLITLAFVCLLLELGTFACIAFGVPMLLSFGYGHVSHTPSDVFSEARAFLAIFGMALGLVLAVQVCYGWGRGEQNLRTYWLRLVDKLYMRAHNTTRSKLRPFGVWSVGLLLLVSVLSSCSSSASATDARQERELPEVTANRLHYRSALQLTRDLQQELQFNEGAFIRLLSLNRNYFEQLSMLPASDYLRRAAYCEHHARLLSKALACTPNNQRSAQAAALHLAYLADAVESHSVL